MKKGKIITSFLLIVAMLTLTVQTAFAAEGEIWYKNGRYPAEYTITDTNLTPYKVINETGVLVVYGHFWKADSASYSNVKLTVEIREYGTNTVLKRVVAENTQYPYGDPFYIEANVQAGQKIQLFFDVSSIDNPPGPLRQATVKYEAYFAD